MPSVYLSAAGAVSDLDLAVVTVHSRPRLGDDESGTMWGSETSAIVPPRRLVAFVRTAALESWRVLAGLRDARVGSEEDLERL